MPPESHPSARRRDESRSARRAPRVLVADDDSSTREVLRACLEVEGYRVVTARDGHEALERLAEARPSVVVCDVRMPVLDGYDVLKGMQERTELRSIPVVLISGNECPRGLPAGCRAFLTKPLDVDALVRLVGKLAGDCGHVGRVGQ